MEDGETPLLAVACRFVPYDQWLVTHLSTSWRIKQVKLWLLSKCNLAANMDVSNIDLPRYRPISPITFATVTKASALDYDEDEEEFTETYDGDSDALSSFESVEFSYSSHKVKPRPAGSHALRPSISNADVRAQQQRNESAKQLSTRYTLVTFSTGHILEDDFFLSWYNLRPYELLELHLAGAVVSLPREVMLDYVKPYFMAKVKVLRKEGDVPREGSIRIPQGTKVHAYSSDPPARKKGKMKLEWKERWIIIHQGVLNLCKNRTDPNPIQRISLSSINALRGAEHLSRLSSIVADPRIVCAQIRSAQTSVITTPRSAPSSPVDEHRRTGGRGSEDRNDNERYTGDLIRDDPEWIIMDLLDDNAFTSILRILHRDSPKLVSSSFLPASSTVISNTPSPTPTTPFASTATITPTNPIPDSPLFGLGALPYPEWRISLVNKAHKAGMGDVGLAMDWVLRGHGSLTPHTGGQRDTGMSDEEGDEELSDIEWRGWMRDLERQARTQQYLDTSQRRRRVTSCGIIPSSPIASSPDSEANILFPFASTFPSPSKSLGPADRLASNQENRHAFAQRPRSPLSSEDMPAIPLIPPIHGGRMMTTTITSTVSVGTGTANTRRRSSTVTGGMSSRLRKKKDKGKEKESEESGTKGSENTKSSFRPKLSLMFTDHPLPTSSSTPYPSERSVSVASMTTGNSDQHSRTTSILKHVRSGSSLYRKREENEPSSPGKEDDSSGGVRRRLGIVKGVSAQAEKLARGLDSALDFVEGRAM